MARNKVTVIGAGNVGATTAQRIAEAGLADVVLVDIVEGLPQGKGARPGRGGAGRRPRRPDHRHERLRRHRGLATSSSSRPGLARQPGMSRDDLLAKNAGIVRAVVEQAAGRSPDAILIIVTNPLDAMCHVALQASGFPRERVLGMAGVLDSARFRTFIAQELGVSRRGHPRLRPRRPRRHDGPAVALLDRRRRADHRAAAGRAGHRRSRSGRPTAAPRSWRCSRPARRSTRPRRRRSRWSSRSCSTGSASCPARSCSRASSRPRTCSSGCRSSSARAAWSGSSRSS